MIRTGRHAFVFFAWLLALLVSSRASANYPEILAPVNDFGGVLTDSAESQIGKRIEQHFDATKVQIAVLVVDTTHGQPIEDYAFAVASQWGGGVKGRDDGVLFVLAVADRQMRLELGYGIEGRIPDALARRLLDAAIPFLRAGDYANAVHVVVEGVIGLTGGTSRANELLVAPEADPYEVYTPKVSYDPGDASPSPSKGRLPEVSVDTAVMVGILAFVACLVFGVVLSQRAKLAAIAAVADTPEVEKPIDDIELPSMGHAPWMIPVIIVLGTLLGLVGAGWFHYFPALFGCVIGYFAQSALATVDFSSTSTGGSSWSSSSHRSSSWSSFGSSSSSSRGSSSRSSSRSSWSGGGGRFGGGGASSRW